MTPTSTNTVSTTTASTGTALTVTGLIHSYGADPAAVRALHGLDLALPRGSFTAVMGPSGSGKSTFLSCVAGLEHPEQGSVVVGDTELTTLSESARTAFRRERLGMVFQGFHLLPYLTAAQNVELPIRLAGHRIDRTARSADPGSARPGRSRPITRTGCLPSCRAASSSGWRSHAHR